MGVLTLVSAHALPIHLSPHKHEWTFLAHVSATPHLGISPQAQSSDSHYNALGQHRCFAGTYCYLWVRSCPHVLLPLHLWSILTLIFILNYDYKPSILYWFLYIVCLRQVRQGIIKGFKHHHIQAQLVLWYILNTITILFCTWALVLFLFTADTTDECILLQMLLIPLLSDSKFGEYKWLYLIT